jgi:hypothetical protein
MSWCGWGVVEEDRLDGDGEEAGDAEGEGQRGVVLAGFDRVDGLTGDFEAFREILLGPGDGYSSAEVR